MKNGDKKIVKRIVVLDNVRSVLNVGAIFRTADAIGECEIWLVGVTPAPIDRFGRTRNDLHKTALGAETTVPWRAISNEDFLGEVLARQKDGYKILAIEQAKNSVDYKKVKTNDKTILIFGNETEGVDLAFQKIADEIIEIPMAGEKESLNVSVTAGIILFRLFDK